MWDVDQRRARAGPPGTSAGCCAAHARSTARRAGSDALCSSHLSSMAVIGDIGSPSSAASVPRQWKPVSPGSWPAPRPRGPAEAVRARAFRPVVGLSAVPVPAPISPEHRRTRCQGWSLHRRMPETPGRPSAAVSAHVRAATPPVQDAPGLQLDGRTSANLFRHAVSAGRRQGRHSRGDAVTCNVMPPDSVRAPVPGFQGHVLKKVQCPWVGGDVVAAQHPASGLIKCCRISAFAAGRAFAARRSTRLLRSRLRAYDRG